MKQKILIADDFEGDRFIVKANLKKYAKIYDVVEAESGERALEIINNDDVGFMFLDYMMPDMDGIEVLKQLYDSENEIAPCPIVMLTAADNESVVMDAIEFGAQDYIMKDNITSEGLHLVITKSKKSYDLRAKHNETKLVLEHAQKMEAIGRLTGGISHDFNNLLAVIYGNLKLLNALLEEDEINKQDCLRKVDMLKMTADRGSELVQRLMTFSQQKHQKRDVVCINDIIKDVASLLERSIGSQINLKMQQNEGKMYILIQRGQLENVIINLAINARDAMPEGGDLNIAVEEVKIKGDQDEALQAGSYAKLVVSDTGQGIADDIREEIFKPFFTTKQSDKGNGLGLSMAYTFMKDLGGVIRLDEIKGYATSFALYFPIENRAEGSIHAEKVEPKTARKKRDHDPVILFVEDDQGVAEATIDILQQNKYTVLSASSGAQAFDMFNENKERIDIVVSDIVMPGEINGIQLARKINEIEPDMPLLLVTGFADDKDQEFKTHSFPVLMKPYETDDLIDEIEGLLL